MFFLIIFQWIENHINRCDSRSVVRCDPAVKKTAAPKKEAVKKEAVKKEPAAKKAPAKKTAAKKEG